MNRNTLRHKHFFLAILMNVLLALTLSGTAQSRSKPTPQSSPAAQPSVAVGQQTIPPTTQNATTTQRDAAASSQSTPATSPAKDEVKESKPVTYSWGALGLAIFMFLVLGLLFWVQFWWSPRVERAAFLGTLFQDSVKEIEFKRLSAKYDEDFLQRRYHHNVRHDAEWLKLNPAPKGYFRGQNRFPGENRPPTGYRPPPGLGPWESRGERREPTAEERKAAELREQQEEKFENEVREWEQKVDDEATKRYHADLNSAQEQASIRAGRAVDIDFSVLQGKGPEFVLGFTTIVVIVFGVVVLGVLQVLKPEQIGTLLAAIAGYVLGRATSRMPAATEKPQPSAQEPTQSQGKALRRAA